MDEGAERHMTAGPATEIHTAGAFSVHDGVTGDMQGRLSQLPLHPGGDSVCLLPPVAGHPADTLGA